jgi:hypothetical protein
MGGPQLRWPARAEGPPFPSSLPRPSPCPAPPLPVWGIPAHPWLIWGGPDLHGEHHAPEGGGAPQVVGNHLHPEGCLPLDQTQAVEGSGLPRGEAQGCGRGRTAPWGFGGWKQWGSGVQLWGGAGAEGGQAGGSCGTTSGLKRGESPKQTSTSKLAADSEGIYKSSRSENPPNRHSSWCHFHPPQPVIPSPLPLSGTSVCRLSTRISLRRANTLRGASVHGRGQGEARGRPGGILRQNRGVAGCALWRGDDRGWGPSCRQCRRGVEPRAQPSC